MDNYRLNVLKILELLQTLFQNGRIQTEKNELVKMTKDGLSDRNSRIRLGNKISELLENEQETFFKTRYENILQLIEL